MSVWACFTSTVTPKKIAIRCRALSWAGYVEATRVHDSLGGIAVGQVVLAAMPRGSPAAPRRQVNAPLARTHDLPYPFPRPPILSQTQATRASPAPLDKRSWYMENTADSGARGGGAGQDGERLAVLVIDG